jgi:translation elongation factor EF-G
MTVDGLAILREELKNSSKERRETREAFLGAIDRQSKTQQKSSKELGDRFERAISELKTEIHTTKIEFTKKFLSIMTISLILMAALGGVSVTFLNDTTDTEIRATK